MLLLIFYHTSLGSTWNDKEKQPKPTIFTKFSTLIYFQNYTNLSIFLIWIWRSGLTFLLHFSNWLVILYLQTVPLPDRLRYNLILPSWLQGPKVKPENSNPFYLYFYFDYADSNGLKLVENG